ncbi:hypothetical protein [Jiangella anatolica]|uniref:hypothetical protein n=1 Tax=Jiangella anatolica TaxID=2670374 RepID=UPI0011B7BEE0|nr:hypothetical protein [Jiangella anatolica]
MRSPEEQALSTMLEDVTAGIDLDEDMLTRVMREGRRRRLRTRAAGTALLAGSVALAGVVVVQSAWNRDEDTSVATPELTATPEPSPSAAVPDPAMQAAFETTRAALAALLAVNVSRYQEEQFHLALDHRTGNAILYLPHTGTIDPAEMGPVDVDQLAADAVETAQATPGAAPVVPVVGVALIDELDAVSVQLFQTRADWASDPHDVYWTYPDPEEVSVTVGVAALSTAADLPSTMQLASGATATIRSEVSAAGGPQPGGPTPGPEPG